MFHTITARVFGMTRQATLHVEDATIGRLRGIKIRVNGQFGDFEGIMSPAEAVKLGENLIEAGNARR